MDPEKVGRDLGVRAILTGRLIQSGDDLMISVNLEDVQDKRQIWGAQYNRKLSNLRHDINGDLALIVAAAISYVKQGKLRALGATRRQVLSSVLAEAVTVGLLASAVSSTASCVFHCDFG